jgi:hypothetical protein
MDTYIDAYMKTMAGNSPTKFLTRVAFLGDIRRRRESRDTQN